MSFFKKKTKAAEVSVGNSSNMTEDLEAVMKKYDRESNTRVWEGVPKTIVTCILAAFSIFCIYVTLFATWLDEIRLTSFMAFKNVSALIGLLNFFNKIF